MDYAGRLTVEDGDGGRFQLYEFRGQLFFKATRRFVLETGEAVNRIDFDHYETSRTHKPLLRI